MHPLRAALLTVATSAVACGAATTPLDARPPPPECLRSDPPGVNEGDGIRVKVGEVYEVALRVFALGGQSSPGVMEAERLPDRLRFTARRPGVSKVYLLRDGGPTAGCIALLFDVKP